MPYGIALYSLPYGKGFRVYFYLSKIMLLLEKKIKKNKKKNNYNNGVGWAGTS